MLDDTGVPGTPAWWLLRLGRRLSSEQPRFDRLDAYARGQHPLPYGNRKMRQAYKRLQRQARSNYVGLVAETVLERMKPTGFRAGGTGTDTMDKRAWGWWQANHMDSNAGLVHRAAVVMSRSYVIVGDDGAGAPLVTGEDPRQVIHESDPEDRYRLRSALKVWADDVDNTTNAVLYLPDEIHYFRSTKASAANQRVTWNPQTWDVDTSNDFAPAGVAVNVFGEVPVVPFICRPDLAGNGLGEFEDVTDIQDRINTITLDLAVISAMQAYRQRWVKGVDPEDDKGNPQAMFDPGADLMWITPEVDAQFGEFNQTDLSPLIKAIENAVQTLCAITRCPPHYLVGQIVNASGDALAAAETGLVSKVGEREQEFGESWEAVYRLAGKVLGVDVPDDAEVIWKDPQFRTLTEMSAASVQMEAAGVPWRTRMAMLDKTPTEIERMAVERKEDAELNAPVPVTPPPLAASVHPPNYKIPTANV
ncbi:MAG TPA: phage portal protein [Pseudonocardiaceae bacterium]|nr:phage portal protein [Pseudonocardiaceae bacterium]